MDSTVGHFPAGITGLALDAENELETLGGHYWGLGFPDRERSLQLRGRPNESWHDTWVRTHPFTGTFAQAGANTQLGGRQRGLAKRSYQAPGRKAAPVVETTRQAQMKPSRPRIEVVSIPAA